ncbi:c-type cytochrome [Massilia cellulosiltytica]|uniref:cytochrome c oxidase subunit II n=1 Tax=Massilia cellulosiltytica TaxID=2683234 RepID=UPI0039B4355A
MNGTLQSVLHPAGHDAAVISQFAWVLFGAATVIFVAVMALMALSLRDNARPLRPGLWIAGAGVAFPVLVLSALLTWSTWRSAQLVPQSSQAALSISVTARMWWWEVRYRDPAGGREIVTANEIHIPVGQAVYVGLNAADVIHSLWVPSLSGKRDMIPGRVTGLTLRADRPGVYRGQCAEFCGAQHANMALHVVALAPDAFRDWLRRQASPARAPQGALLERGRAAFLEQRCQTCHTIRGVAEARRLGPDLTHVGSRAHIGAGLLQTHQNTLAGWIADPQAVKPGVFMPAAAGTDGDTLRALAAYLEHLQ